MVLFALLAIISLGALFITAGWDIIHKGFAFNSWNYLQPFRSFSIRATTNDPFHNPFNPAVILKNFIFVFLPSMILAIFGVLWVNTDNFYRTVQPLAAMHDCALAPQSILLDYMQCPSIVALFKAAQSAHWRVAWFSLLAMTANIGPIIAGSIFTSDLNDPGHGFTISVSRRNLWVTICLLVIYLVSLPFALPHPRHHLPRQNHTVADIISYCYESKLVDDRMFHVQGSDDEQIHLTSNVHLAKKSYEFGLYKGKDGRRHFGIDFAGDTYKCDPGRSSAIFGRRVWWRKPRVLKE